MPKHWRGVTGKLRDAMRDKIAAHSIKRKPRALTPYRKAKRKAVIAKKLGAMYLAQFPYLVEWFSGAKCVGKSRYADKAQAMDYAKAVHRARPHLTIRVSKD